jgi:hypothetical protein
MFRTLSYTVFAIVLAVTTPAQAGNAITIWKIGSPHTGDIPGNAMPEALAREAAVHGWSLVVEAFPAQGFAARFAAAARDGAAPDLLVFDNFGIMDGITTPLGTFAGIGADPFVRNQFVQVTTSLDELLPPQRGWVFLFTSSSNYAAARQLALRTPRCPATASRKTLPADLAVPQIAAAYLTGDSGSLLQHVDDERLPRLTANVGVLKAGEIAVCGTWGNERLVVVTATAAYQADTVVGQAPLVLAFRKISSRWQLLAAARDPVSTGEFARSLPTLSTMLVRDIPAGPVPAPAVLRAPQDGRFPVPVNGARFGDFEWQSSTSEDVVAEVAEFRYAGDARLFLLPPQNPGSMNRVSTGFLWTTTGEWAWRVWSITRSGEVAFSDVRTFVH